jgi:predicted  nucleic acid-binding Zn-ribbon protein/SAM-dependent methyltransferase
MEPDTHDADLALAIYLSPLAVGHRVLWLGAVTDAIAARLEADARTLRLLGPSGAEGSSRKLRPGPFRFGPKSFDLVVVPETSAVDVASRERVEELRRSLADDGVLVLATRAAGERAYGELYELGQSAFGEVRMLGQAEFAGFSLVPFGESADAITIDSSAVPPASERPVRYLALCYDSAARPGSEQYTVVRVPATANGAARAESAPPRDRELDDVLARREREMEAATEHAEALERTLAERSAEVDRHRSEIERLQAELIEHEIPVVESTSEDDELGRLESSLREQGKRVRELELEVERRGSLVRDLVEELGRLEAAGPPERATPERAAPIEAPMPERAIAEAVTIPPFGKVQEATALDYALERAVAAEAARAAAEFEVDEVRGRLLEVERSFHDGGRSEAEREGRERGYRARIVELEELRELAEGRLALLQFDLEQSERRERRLHRDIAEAKEQFELELARSHSIANEASARGTIDDLEADRAAARRLGTLSGQLVACREELETQRIERDQARAETLRLTARVSMLEEQLEGQERGYERRVAELSDDASRVQANAADALALRGEIEGLRFLVNDRSAALDAVRRDDRVHHDEDVGRLKERMTRAEADADRARSEHAVAIDELAHFKSEVDRLSMFLTQRTAVEGDLAEAHATIDRLKRALEEQTRDSERLVEAQDELDRMRDEIAELRAKDSAQTVRLSDAEELAEIESNRAADLASTVAARDALVSRLQMDLADEEQRARDATQRVSRMREESDRLREALVNASARVDRVEALEREVADKASEAAAREAELEKLRGETSAQDRRIAELGDALESARADHVRTRGQFREAMAATRLSLSSLGEELGVVLQKEVSSASTITAVGIESPDWTEEPPSEGVQASVLRARVAELELLVRSATAQLEERDDRVRALEKRLDGGTGSTSEVEVLERELLELKERSSRLAEELDVERRARRAAESATSPGLDPEALAELRAELAIRDRELGDVRRVLLGRERELKTTRDAAARARAGLEELLGITTSSGDPATADRVGALLRILAPL